MQLLPLVSVVMPTLNQAAFIEASIDSVLGQNYPNIELIVADGGSLDGTVDLLKARQAADRRLRWFSRQDSGPAQAINAALAEVRGTVVGWLNSDDLYTLGAVGRAAEALAADASLILIYGHGQHIGAQGEPLGRYPSLPPSTPVERFAEGCFICQPTVFFRRSMFVLLGKLDESLQAAFDFDYWLRAFLACPGRIGFVDALQASSRLHEDCITKRMRRRVALEGMQVLARHLGSAPKEWLLTYMDDLLCSTAASNEIQDLRTHIKLTIDEASSWLQPKELQEMKLMVKKDSRF